MYDLQNESPAFVMKNYGGFLIISSNICNGYFSLKEVFFEAPCDIPEEMYCLGLSCTDM